MRNNPSSVIALFTITVIALAAGFVLTSAGCGRSLSPGEVLEKSQEKIESLKSVKADVTMSESTEFDSSYERSDMEFVADILIDGKITPDFELHGTMNDESFEGYGIEGVQYFNIPRQGWLKIPATTGSTGVTGMTGFSTPGDFAELWVYADEPKLERSGDDTYVITFQIKGEDLMEGKYGTVIKEQLGQSTEAIQQYVSSQLQGEYGQMVEDQLIESLGPNYMDALIDSFEGSTTDFEVKIDRDTFYLLEAAVVSHAMLPGEKKFDSEIETRFFGFNEPVSITLPPEAESAEEVQMPFSPLTPLPGR